MVRRARAGVPVDYAALRFVFARLPEPRMAVHPDTLIQHARRAVTHEAARAAVDSLLEGYYGSAIAHEIVTAVLRARGDSAGAHAAELVLARFVRSMGDSATAGRTRAAAIDVVSVPEEYFYLRAMGLERAGMQATGPCPGGECDTLEVKEKKTGKPLEMYFRWTRAADREAPAARKPPPSSSSK